MSYPLIRFECFPTNVAAGVHAGWLNADTDTIKFMLSSTPPVVATMVKKADATEITEEHGYTGAVDIENAATKTGTTITIAAVDKTLTGTGGSFGPYQYCYFFNDTAVDKPLIGYYNYGAPITTKDTAVFIFDADVAGWFTFGG